MGKSSALIRYLGVAGVVTGALLLASCATPAADDPDAQAAYAEANDPIEPLNRYFFEFNRFIDSVALRPVAEVYDGVVPDFAQGMVHNFLFNLRSPVTLANDVLQGKLGRAHITAVRIVTNSTLGIGGLFDVAADWGWEPHEEDFGQTLAVWGVGEGPYLVLPFLGPSPPRDTVGSVIDHFFDPLDLYAESVDDEWIIYARRGSEIVDFRARNLETFDEIERSAIDFYATVRSLYRQHRAAEIRDGSIAPLVPVPQISIETDTDEGINKVSLTSSSSD
jgi:phospholipid-binding lipoprotein MlaA